MVMVAHFNQEGLLKQHHPWLGPLTTKFALTGLWGVELFFVLSGFLITGILLDAKGKTRYFYNFYGRRFVRIFPLYYAALFTVFAVVPLFSSLDDGARSIFSQQWRLWLYVTNVPGGPGWDISEVFKLGHFWSLAVEEHFYLLWPLVVYRNARKRLPLVCLGLIVTASIARLGYAVLERALCCCGGLQSARLMVWPLGPSWPYWSGRKTCMARLSLWPARVWFPWGYSSLGLDSFPGQGFSSAIGERSLIGEPISIAFFAVLLILSIQVGQAAMPTAMRIPILMSLGKYSYGLYVIHGILRPALVKWFPPARFAEVSPIPILGRPSTW